MITTHSRDKKGAGYFVSGVRGPVNLWWVS